MRHQGHRPQPHPPPPRHANPRSVHQVHPLAGGGGVLTAISATTTGDLLPPPPMNGGGTCGVTGQQQQQMVVATTGGSTGSGGGGGAFVRSGGLPLIVAGPPPTHPHGPLLRGNLVPRLLAPLPQSAVGGPPGTAPGSLPRLYAIVKPQQQQQSQRVHVCVPVAATHHPSAGSMHKLGPATAPGKCPAVDMVREGGREMR